MGRRWASGVAGNHPIRMRSARDLVQADIVVLGQPMSPAPNAITSMPIAIGEPEYMQGLADEHPLGW